MCHLGSVESLGEGADLVELPEQRVGRADLEAARQALRVGREEVVADDLDVDFRGQFRVTLEVLFVERFLDRDDVVLVDEFLVELDHAVAVTFDTVDEVGALVLVVVVGRGGVEPVTEAAFVAGCGDGLVEQAQRLVRVTDRWCEATFVTRVEGDLAVSLEQDVGEEEVDLGADLERFEH